MFVFSCEGCATKKGVTESEDDRLKVRDYYSKMTDVQPLNWFDYTENRIPTILEWRNIV